MSIQSAIYEGLQRTLTECSPKKGMYRKCDGSYIFVVGFSMSNLIAKTPMQVHYYEVAHPEVEFTMDYSEFVLSGDKVLSRPDNVTGQDVLFLPIRDVKNEEKEMTTKALIKELCDRVDSPLQDLSYEGICSRVFCTEYVVGEPVEEKIDYQRNNLYPRGVTNIIGIYDTYEKALEARRGRMTDNRLKIFRRSWVEEAR